MPLRSKQWRRWKNASKYLYGSVINGSIMGFGDVIAQTVVEKKSIKDVDGWRTAKYASIGAVIISPVLTRWFSFLEQKIPPEESQLRRGMKKMLLDQTTMSPILNFVVMSSVAILNHHTWSQMKEEIPAQYPHILKMNYLVWPAVQIINFTFLPLAYQVVFLQFVAIFWNCFVSQFLYGKDSSKDN